MASERGQIIKNLMWREVAEKGVAAAFTFSTFAIIVFFYHYGIREHKTTIQIFSVIAILSNIARLVLTRLILKTTEISRKHKNLLRACIWSNTFAWSAIFTIGVWTLKGTGSDFAILVTMISGFVGASIVTLSADKTIFLPFQILMLTPLALISYYHWRTGDNPSGIYLVISCVMFLLYQLKQMKTYRYNMIQRFNYQLDLEKSLKEVKDAQQALVNQTASLLHNSKITALGEMAGGLSHEVNNSLQVLLTASQQIQRELIKKEIVSPSLQSKLDQMLTSISKIKNVIDGLRYFSQEMESGPMEVVSLRQVIDQTMAFTRELLSAHNVRLNINEIPDLKIDCHPFQIAHILFNLIKNADDAIRFIPEDKWIEVSFKVDEKCVLIFVKNSGPPIRPEVEQKLFQPFFSTKDVNVGTGLSLSISRGMALGHKGELIYLSGERHTTFLLKLPYEK